MFVMDKFIVFGLRFFGWLRKRQLSKLRLLVGTLHVRINRLERKLKAMEEEQ